MSMLSNTLRKLPWQRTERRAFLGYLGMAAFCIVFSTVYEIFSHQVYSAFMIGLAAFPLLLGALPVLIIRRQGRQGRTPLQKRLQLWSVLTLTVGSCLTGVFEIYGTASQYTIIYWIAGAMLTAAAAAAFIREHRVR